MSLDFYENFEAKHRGPRDLIKSRLRVYLPFVGLLEFLYPGCKAVDLGCGRGEWLELLKEADVDAHGVDLDAGMLSFCRELSLSVETSEAVSYLKTLPDESQVIISGFHLAEHIPFSDLQILVQEALRVLKPAGLLILETPNPENIVVGTVNFYVDPTHQRPIPPMLLAFLPEHYGFYRTKTLRLQESVEFAEKKAISLLTVLNGVSPDYAIVAQKSAPDEQLTGFNEIFAKEYGLTLEELTMRYDAQAANNAALAEAAAQQAQAILSLSQMAAAREQALGAQVVLAQDEIQRLGIENIELSRMVESLHNSLSIRITAPLRLISRLFRGELKLIAAGPNRFLELAKLQVKNIIRWLVSLLRTFHVAKKMARFFRARYPNLWNKFWYAAICPALESTQPLSFAVSDDCGSNGVQQAPATKGLMSMKGKDHQQISKIVEKLKQEIARQRNS